MVKGLIIDANLLLLLVIGSVEEGRHIGNSKRLKSFSISDYYNLLKYLKDYQVFITPYIATEVSNLIDLKGRARDLAFQFAQIMFSRFEQIDVNIEHDCSSELFVRFGITDASIINLASSYCVLTNDLQMLTPLYEQGIHNVLPYIPDKEL